MIRNAMNSMHCGGSTMPHYSWMMTLQCRSAGQDSAVTGSGLQQRRSLLSLRASLISRKISRMIRRRTWQFRSLSAPIGQQTKTVLSDGTVVWLNSGSELEICERAEGERRVKLCGEAYLGCRARHRPSLYRGDIAHGGPSFGYPIQRQCLR